MGMRIGAVADSSGGVFLDNNSQLERALSLKQSGLRLRDAFEADFVPGASEFIRKLPAAGVSALVESLPTNIIDGQPALGLISAALEQGTNVVTVDKGPLVHGFHALEQASRKGHTSIRYSGTTGVTPPAEVASDRVLEIRGVLNGTTNYLLTEMQQRERSFDDALAQAQEEGIAEPDPSLDVEGWDTAAKILILAKSLMGADATLGEVSRIGIGAQTAPLIQTARSTGRLVRLMGRARIWQGRVRVSVAPKLIGPDSPFYSVSGTSKAAVFRTESHGEVLSFAKSGRDAISQTILEDLIKLA